MIDIEERLERREALALNLAEQLSAKIDECEALKEEVRILREHARWRKEEITRLNNLINSMPLADHVDTTGGEWAWKEYGPNPMEWEK